MALSSIPTSVISGLQSGDHESYSLGISGGDNSLRIEVDGFPADIHTSSRAIYVKTTDLTKVLSDKTGWTVITEPLPDVGEPDEDGDFLIAIGEEPEYWLVGESFDHTPDDIRRAALQMLAIANKMEKVMNEDVNTLTFLLDEANRGARDPSEVALNLLRAGVKPPSR